MANKFAESLFRPALKKRGYQAPEISRVALIAVVGFTQYGRAQSQGKASFFCGTDNGEPATIARLPQSSRTKTLIVGRIDTIRGYPQSDLCDGFAR